MVDFDLMKVSTKFSPISFYFPQIFTLKNGVLYFVPLSLRSNWRRKEKTEHATFEIELNQNLKITR